MRERASVFVMIGAVLALQALLALASFAADGNAEEEPAVQEGEDRWVPSLAITAGATIEEHQGFSGGVYFPDGSPTPLPIRDFVNGRDIAASPFVGASLELMTPALPIPTRPRLFVSGEILPTFASERGVAVDGDPDCVSGPEPDVPCAKDEPFGARKRPFGVTDVNGTGAVTKAWVDDLVFGASLGMAFPVRIGERELRIKPSARWIRYEVQAEGLLVGAACNPASRCTNYYSTGDPPVVLGYGYLRERILEASASHEFDGIGPGLEIEMDTGRFGPIGSSLFLGGGAYRVLGDRVLSFGTTVSFPEERSVPADLPDRVIFAPETDVADFSVEVAPWMFRAHVGIRFQWLGSRK